LSFKIHKYTIFVIYTLYKIQISYNYSNYPWWIKVFKNFLIFKLKFINRTGSSPLSFRFSWRGRSCAACLTWKGSSCCRLEFFVGCCVVFTGTWSWLLSKIWLRCRKWWKHTPTPSHVFFFLYHCHIYFLELQISVAMLVNFHGVIFKIQQFLWLSLWIRYDDFVIPWCSLFDYHILCGELSKKNKSKH
jgi:hypothetical protein